jgi:hypothetical protein
MFAMSSSSRAGLLRLMWQKWFRRQRVAAMLSGFIGFFALAPAGARVQSTDIPFSPERWILSQRNFKIPEEEEPRQNGEVVKHLGRQSFRLSRGLAYSKDVALQNGTIDVDMALDEKTRFLGLAFHVKSDDEYEVIFFRPGKSGTTEAVQYTPGLHGANAWQLYTGPGYTAAAALPRNKWIHVRITIAGTVAKLFLDNAAAPTLVVSDLRLGQVKGSIGFWGHLGGGYFSNLTVTPNQAAYTPEVKQKILTGALTDWELSDILDPSEKNPAVYSNALNLSWEKVSAEPPGIVVINRFRRSPNVFPPEREERIRGLMPGAKFVFARTKIRSDRDQVLRMKLGYSDEVVLFLNGVPLYEGRNEFGFRQGNFLGLLDAESDAVYLPLKKGDNELMLAVTEFFGGWGFICRLGV